MSEQDRGAYAPLNETPLAFDPRHDGERRGPAPLALIVSVLILIALAAGLVVFYRHGVRKPGQAPQVVGAPIGDTKSPPLSSEAPSDATAGLQVYKTETPPPGEGQAPAAQAPTLAPAPEQPQARPVARPVPVAPVAVTPLRAAEPAPPPVVIRQAAVKPVAAKPLPVAAPEPAAPAAVKAPVPVKAAKPAAVLAASSAKPAKPKPAAVAKATPAPSAAAPAVSGGGTTVQIGAFSSQALAEKGWSDAAHAVPAGAAGKTRKFESVSKDGKTFTRAYIGGFASHADAVAFCSALKAAGKPCFVK
jgi:cytoskeletal protein RodZ